VGVREARGRRWRATWDGRHRGTVSDGGGVAVAGGGEGGVAGRGVP